MTPKPAVGPDGGVELPSADIWRIWFADMWIDYWFVIVPLICVACFGIASLFGRSSAPDQGPEAAKTFQSEN
jgi:hypothetical protein